LAMKKAKGLELQTLKHRLRDHKAVLSHRQHQNKKELKIIKHILKRRINRARAKLILSKSSSDKRKAKRCLRKCQSKLKHVEKQQIRVSKKEIKLSNLKVSQIRKRLADQKGKLGKVKDTNSKILVQLKISKLETKLKNENHKESKARREFRVLKREIKVAKHPTCKKMKKIMKSFEKESIINRVRMNQKSSEFSKTSLKKRLLQSKKMALKYRVGYCKAKIRHLKEEGRTTHEWKKKLRHARKNEVKVRNNLRRVCNEDLREKAKSLLKAESEMQNSSGLKKDVVSQKIKILRRQIKADQSRILHEIKGQERSLTNRISSLKIKISKTIGEEKRRAQRKLVKCAERLDRVEVKEMGILMKIRREQLDRVSTLKAKLKNTRQGLLNTTGPKAKYMNKEKATLKLKLETAKFETDQTGRKLKILREKGSSTSSCMGSAPNRLYEEQVKELEHTIGKLKRKHTQLKEAVQPSIGKKRTKKLLLI